MNSNEINGFEIISQIHDPSQCANPECTTCGFMFCPLSDPLHFNYRGCPAGCGKQALFSDQENGLVPLRSDETVSDNLEQRLTFNFNDPAFFDSASHFYEEYKKIGTDNFSVVDERLLSTLYTRQRLFFPLIKEFRRMFSIDVSDMTSAGNVCFITKSILSLILNFHFNRFPKIMLAECRKTHETTNKTVFEVTIGFCDKNGEIFDSNVDVQKPNPSRAVIVNGTTYSSMKYAKAIDYLALFGHHCEIDFAYFLANMLSLLWINMDAFKTQFDNVRSVCNMSEKPQLRLTIFEGEK